MEPPSYPLLRTVIVAMITMDTNPDVMIPMIRMVMENLKNEANSVLLI